MSRMSSFLNVKSVCNWPKNGKERLSRRNRILFSGDGVAFIYPDFSTALRGTFSSGQMVSAKEVTVAGYDDDSDSLSFGPAVAPAVAFSYDPSGRDVMASDPMLKDPYEARLAEIRQSTIPKVSESETLDIT